MTNDDDDDGTNDEGIPVPIGRRQRTATTHGSSTTAQHRRCSSEEQARATGARGSSSTRPAISTEEISDGGAFRGSLGRGFRRTSSLLSTRSSDFSTIEPSCFAPFFSAGGPYQQQQVLGNAFDLIVVAASDDANTGNGDDTCCSGGGACNGSASSSNRANEQSPRTTYGYACSDCFYDFGSAMAIPPGYSVVLEVESLATIPFPASEAASPAARFPVRHRKIRAPDELHLAMDEREGIDSDDDALATVGTSNVEHSQSALETLVAMLQPGRNTTARYLLLDGSEDSILAVAPLCVHVWSSNDQVLVVDIDGTITRSNIRGVVDTVLTEQYLHCHAGVCKFFTQLLLQKQGVYRESTNATASSSLSSSPGSSSRNRDSARQQYAAKIGTTPVLRVLYLSSRPIALANATRKFLLELCQNHITTQQQHCLPHGAFMAFPGTLTQVLMMELMSKSVNEFKSQTLQTQVLRLFSQVRRDWDGASGRASHPDCHNGGNEINIGSCILIAGFGNTVMDMQAYHECGLDMHSLYLVDKESKIYCLDNYECGNKKIIRRDTTAQKATSQDNVDNRKKSVEFDRRIYLRARGSFFERGYEDDSLISHVLNGVEASTGG